MESHPASPAGRNDGESTRSHSWALPLVLAAVVALVGALAIFRPGLDGPRTPSASRDSVSTESWTPSPRPEGQTVSLAIDFGNGARREFDALPWTEGLTLGKLMRRAADFRPGVRFAQRGEGPMAFLTSLEGVANEGGGGRYWFYTVDDRRGEMSFEVQSLAAGDRVLWIFKSAD